MFLNSFFVLACSGLKSADDVWGRLLHRFCIERIETPDGQISWCALWFQEPCFVIGEPPAKLWIRSLTPVEFSVTKKIEEFLMEYSCQPNFIVVSKHVTCVYTCVTGCYWHVSGHHHSRHDAWRGSLWASWDLLECEAMAMPYRRVNDVPISFGKNIIQFYLSLSLHMYINFSLYRNRTWLHL